MSHFYSLVCKTCNAETEEVNYGKEKIKQFVSKWEENKDALSKVLSLDLIDIGDIHESFRTRSLPPDIYQFMLAHEKHELVIRSEYASVGDEMV